MLRKLCLIGILSFAFSACQTPEEKAAEEFLEELENMPEPTYITDYDACVEFFTAVVPLIVQCSGEENPIDAAWITNECTAMGCNTVADNSLDWNLEDCLEYYSTCASIEADNPPAECDMIMMSCDFYYDDTESDTDL
jgi:hypothetical protein